MPAWIEQTLQDLRYAFRGLCRNPAFALTALLAAAIAIGATTAVFSAVDRILFRSLPYREEARLVSTGIMAPLDSNEFLLANAVVGMDIAGTLCADRRFPRECIPPRGFIVVADVQPGLRRKRQQPPDRAVRTSGGALTGSCVRCLAR